MPYARAVDLVLMELEASIAKHGNWFDYTTDKMMDVTLQELMIEAGEAEQRGDVFGPHGMIRELAQTAACCVKAIVALEYQASKTLAEIIQPVGLNRSGEGRVAPASPSLHHPENSSTNHPDEVRHGN